MDINIETNQLPLLLTVEEFSVLARVSLLTVRKDIKKSSPELAPFVRKVGREYRILRDYFTIQAPEQIKISDLQKL